MLNGNTNENENNRKVFEEMKVPKALATLAVPTIVGQLIVLIYNLADTFYIGRTNNPLMVAGVSLILPIFNMTVSLAGLGGVGGGSLISRLLGSKQEEEAKKVCSFSFYLSILFALLFSIFIALFMNPLLRTLGGRGEAFIYARQYALCVLVLGGIPTVLSMTMANLLRSVGCARQAGIGVSMGGIINIILDPLFMFVLLPKGMEIYGVGLATLCSNLISCLYFFIIIYRMRENTVLTFSPKAGLPQINSVKSVFGVGIPSSLATLFFDLDYVVVDKLTSGYGDIALASIGIVLKAERLPLNVGIGLCQGMMPLAAYSYSAGNYIRMKKTVSFSRLAGLIIAIMSVILYQIFAGQILRLFIADSETVRIGTNFLRIRCLATPFMFMCFHIVYLFQALGRGDRALLLAVIRWLVFNIPMLFILNHFLGMYGIVWSQITADIFTVLVSFLVYYRFEKKLLQSIKSE